MISATELEQQPRSAAAGIGWQAARAFGGQALLLREGLKDFVATLRDGGPNQNLKPPARFFRSPQLGIGESNTCNPANLITLPARNVQ